MPNVASTSLAMARCSLVRVSSGQKSSRLWLARITRNLLRIPSAGSFSTCQLFAQTTDVRLGSRLLRTGNWFLVAARRNAEALSTAVMIAHPPAIHLATASFCVRHHALNSCLADILVPGPAGSRAIARSATSNMAATRAVIPLQLLSET